MNRQFPRLEISRSRLRHNMEEVISRCTAQGIQVCGVIKGCSGLPEVGRMFRDCGATQLASSRLEQIVRCRRAGMPPGCGPRPLPPPLSDPSGMPPGPWCRSAALWCFSWRRCG